MTRQSRQVHFSHIGNSNKTIQYGKLGYTGGQVYSRFDGHGVVGGFVGRALVLKRGKLLICTCTSKWFKYCTYSHFLSARQPLPSAEVIIITPCSPFLISFPIASVNHRLVPQLSNSVCVNAFITRAFS